MGQEAASPAILDERPSAPAALVGRLLLRLGGGARSLRKTPRPENGKKGVHSAASARGAETRSFGARDLSFRQAVFLVLGPCFSFCRPRRDLPAHLSRFGFGGFRTDRRAAVGYVVSSRPQPWFRSSRKNRQVNVRVTRIVVCPGSHKGCGTRGLPWRAKPRKTGAGLGGSIRRAGLGGGLINLVDYLGRHPLDKRISGRGRGAAVLAGSAFFLGGIAKILG